LGTIQDAIKNDVKKAFKSNIIKVYGLVYSIVAIPMIYYGLNFIQLVYSNILVFLSLTSVVMTLSVIICLIVQQISNKQIYRFLNNEDSQNYDSSNIKKNAYYFPLFVVAVMDFGWLVLMNLITFLPMFFLYAGNIYELIIMNLLIISGAMLSTPITYFICESTSAKFLSLKEVARFEEPSKIIKISINTKILIVCLILIVSLVLNITSGMLLAILHNLTQIQTIINILIVSAQAIAAAVVVSILFAHSLTRPILNMKTSTGFIKNGDISINIQKTSNDELGDTSESYNEFLNKLSDMITDIKNSVNVTRINVEELDNAMNNTGISVNEINQISTEVQNAITSQALIVSETTAAMQQITSTIRNQDIKINEQSNSINESSTAIEEMLANIKSIADNLNNSAIEFSNLHNSINIGNENIEKLKETVQFLNKQSDSVIEANTIITNIASQTDLLAMNAAIEAAHAGEYGKGFAVVADEIRKLAEVSNQQSKLIFDNLKNLKQSIEDAVIITDQTEKSFEIIMRSVDTVNNLEKEIKNSIDEQSSGSSQMLQALNTINKITQEVHSGSEEMMKGSNTVISEINGLLQITEKVKQSSLSVVEKARTVRNNTDQSLELLKLNKENTKNIDDLVDVFKLK